MTRTTVEDNNGWYEPVCQNCFSSENIDSVDTANGFTTYYCDECDGNYPAFLWPVMPAPMKEDTMQVVPVIPGLVPCMERHEPWCQSGLCGLCDDARLLGPVGPCTVCKIRPIAAWYGFPARPQPGDPPALPLCAACRPVPPPRCLLAASRTCATTGACRFPAYCFRGGAL